MVARVTLLALETDRLPPTAKRVRAVLESSCAPRFQVHSVSQALGREGELGDILQSSQPDVILLAMSSNLIRTPGNHLHLLRNAVPETPFLVVAEEAEPADILTLMRQGAADFVLPPMNAANVLPRLWRLLDQKAEGATSVQRLKEKLGLKQLLGESRAFADEIKKIPPVAKCDTGVLLCGETGTGKELFARAIHYLSPRASKPFVPINCSAIPVELAESELFGHERGAFTGAVARRNGLIQAAEGGTIFLDDVDCVPLPLQSKLLRFLQEKQYRMLGSTSLCTADVRVIAATNVDLPKAIEKGQFRQDLYYRLHVIPFSLPALRDRVHDIPLLAHHFLKKYADELHKPATSFSEDAMHKLVLYPWPGNVRELENVVQGVVVLSQGPLLRACELNLPSEVDEVHESFRHAKAKVVAQFERNYIKQLLIAHGGNISRAARAAGKNRRAFWELIRRHRIDVQSFKCLT